MAPKAKSTNDQTDPVAVLATGLAALARHVTVRDEGDADLITAATDLAPSTDSADAES